MNHLLDMVEETTNQLLDTKQTQGDVVATLEGRGHDLEQITSRCSDLEERLREEVERKDFLALELHKAEGEIHNFILVNCSCIFSCSGQMPDQLMRWPVIRFCGQVSVICL